MDEALAPGVLTALPQGTTCPLGRHLVLVCLGILETLKEAGSCCDVRTQSRDSGFWGLVPACWGPHLYTTFWGLYPPSWGSLIISTMLDIMLDVSPPPAHLQVQRGQLALATCAADTLVQGPGWLPLYLCQPHVSVQGATLGRAPQRGWVCSGAEYLLHQEAHSGL